MRVVKGEQEGQSSSVEVALLDSFNEAFNRHDVDTIMSMMTPDCVFENTFPAPDGTRYEGQDAVREVWKELFENSPEASFEIDEVIASGDRAVQLWTYRWVDTEGKSGHVRGVDVFRVREGRIAEKLSYVKG